MAEAARVLAVMDTSQPVRVRITRLGKVVGPHPGQLLAWASLDVEGLPQPGLHATLAFTGGGANRQDGLQAHMAEIGEVALVEQRDTVVFNDMEYAVANIPVESLDFVATWRLGSSAHGAATWGPSRIR
jgi:hypothetical protein